ncbi:hypothetical protein DEU56DRAFT_815559 [Suillus clintonianus]|uniref:uncharacterized protein n=1 Tax=Suillus clintonianus TaxID=1904413 RepID=UPI001B864FDE|nr:uncharacterized protein DEU56DRAFT_815559 [Suillus clintonianus]KAG2130356.1 hypothetical protein DEU56DRAFT_815559 [Suillus clintonianus]
MYRNVSKQSMLSTTTDTMSTQTAAFDWLPQEVMENIAFFSATTTDVGPPSDLIPLLLSCKSIYLALSLDTNPHLCARIFEHKFDLSAAVRRMGQQIATPDVLSKELRKRFVYLKRIRARTDSRICAPNTNSPILGELLWLAYLMVLENDGKNVKQLREYAGMEQWLTEYWFDDEGASQATKALLADEWPLDNEHNALAMWLFWLFLKPDRFQRTERNYRTFTTVLKPTALAANKYDICQIPWEAFVPRSCLLEPTSIQHYSNSYHLTPPTMAIPAILSYLSLMGPLVGPTRVAYKGPHHAPNSFPSSLSQSLEWEADWQRCINLAQTPLTSQFSGAYIAGSLQGVWEGVFTYTEFTTYAALLSGRSPSILHNCSVAQHRQTWKLREYHLIVSREADGGADGAKSPSPSLSSGDPLKAFFPPGIRIHEHVGSAEVHEPGKVATLSYKRCDAETEGADVRDIIVVGEGHSAWGQFNIIGRVRPCDGFVSLLKEYVEGDRGQWLYRGYLVGSINGSLSGRWRDTLSLPEANGYEGCFAMRRRR